MAFLFLLALAGTEFILRGPLRALQGSEWTDFLSPYIQTRAWIQGDDPYTTSNLLKYWPAGQDKPVFVILEAENGTLEKRRGMPSPYPVTAFAVLAPLGLLPWKIARTLWLILSLTGCLLMIAVLVDLARGQGATELLVALLLALAPIHTGIATENPVILVVSLCALAFWLVEQSHPIAAGVLLVAAAALKPTIALPFALFFLVARRWTAIATAFIGGVALLSVAGGRLWLKGVPWLQSYASNGKLMFSRGSIDDYTPANRVWFNLINLQLPLYGITRSVPWTEILTLSTTVILLGIWMKLACKLPSGSCRLLSLSALATICLLPVYHRFYDATLLVFSLAWAWKQIRGPLRSIAVASALLIVPFLVPGAAILHSLAESKPTDSFFNQRVWNVVFVSHEAWLILALAPLLVWAMREAEHRGS